VHFFLLMDSEINAKLPMRFVARPPSGNADAYPVMDAGEVEVSAGRENALHVILRDFPVGEYGRYEVRIELPNQVIALDFEILQRAPSV